MHTHTNPAAPEMGLRTSRFSARKVAGIIPVNGWSLLALDEHGDDRIQTITYIAQSADEDVVLQVSRFGFTPTQDRFAWLVGNGFPGPVERAGGCLTPLCDDDIDAALTQQVAA